MLFTLLISNNYKNKPFCRKITNAEKYRLEVVKESKLLYFIKETRYCLIVNY